MSDVTDRLTEYCLHGGLYKSEFMQHEKVRDLLHDCYLEITRLLDEVARLEADRATAVVQTESDYQHEIDTLRAEVERLRLTGSERISLGWGADLLDQRGNWQSAATLRGLLARHGGER